MGAKIGNVRYMMGTASIKVPKSRTTTPHARRNRKGVAPIPITASITLCGKRV